MIREIWEKKKTWEMVARDCGSATGMFGGCASVQTIKFPKNFHAGSNTSWMFQGCSKLEILDVSGFDTANVTDMSYMFQGCSKLETLDVSRFDTANVTNMSCMFSDCDEVRRVRCIKV